MNYSEKELQSGSVITLLIFFFICIQYSEKEDKYEEEIKVLSDKLKEVNQDENDNIKDIILNLCYEVFKCLCVFIRPRPAQNSQRDQWPNWKNPSMTWKVRMHLYA